MRTIATCLSLLMLLVAGGCQPQKPVAPVWQDSKQGLTVQLSVPHRAFAQGEVIPVTVTASNTSDKDMTISANSQAKVVVTVSRETVAGLEEVKRYPATPTMVAAEWRLPAGSAQPFTQTLNVTVSPDWPTYEGLKLAAWLNGRPDVKPAGEIKIYPSKRECDRARLVFGSPP
jgi:hypothetical protein